MKHQKLNTRKAVSLCHGGQQAGTTKTIPTKKGESIALQQLGRSNRGNLKRLIIMNNAITQTRVYKAPPHRPERNQYIKDLMDKFPEVSLDYAAKAWDSYWGGCHA